MVAHSPHYDFFLRPDISPSLFLSFPIPPYPPFHVSIPVLIVAGCILHTSSHTTSPKKLSMLICVLFHSNRALSDVLVCVMWSGFDCLGDDYESTICKVE